MVCLVLFVVGIVSEIIVIGYIDDVLLFGG